DDEVDDRLEELPPREVRVAVHVQALFGDVHPAGGEPDDRHEHVGDERINDPGERGADHHADRQIDDVPAKDELFELIEYGHGGGSEKLVGCVESANGGR